MELHMNLQHSVQTTYFGFVTIENILGQPHVSILLYNLYQQPVYQQKPTI